MDQTFAHIKVLMILGVTRLTSVALADAHEIASILSLICGAIASCAVTYYYLVKKKD
jgi:hypothetical protein